MVPLLVALTGTTVIFYLLNLLIRNPKKTALLVTFGLIVFFSYGHFYYEVRHFMIGGVKIMRHRTLIPSIGLTYIILSYIILRSKSDFQTLTRFFNLTMSILVGFSIFNIVAFQFRPQQFVTSIDQIDSESTSDLSSDARQTPDIYYIIPDGYAGNPVLDQFYNFDNSDFTEYLKNSGFYVAEHSFSNYVQTHLSLASSLNMKYINEDVSRFDDQSTNPSVLWGMIRNSEVMRFLKEHDYSFVLIRSGWGPTDRNPNADIIIKSGNYNEFKQVLIHTTILCVIEPKIFFDDMYRKKVRTQFGELSKIHSARSPKFVLCHFSVPHTPFVFTADGEDRAVDDLTLGQNIWMPREGYVEQLQYVSIRLSEVISEILQNSANPPVIIIQGDHGPASFDEWNNPSDKFVIERTSILNAYYLPGVETDSLSSSISPVNSFRLIFNSYFHSDHVLHQDKCFFSSLDAPYRFTDYEEPQKSTK